MLPTTEGTFLKQEQPTVVNYDVIHQQPETRDSLSSSDSGDELIQDVDNDEDDVDVCSNSKPLLKFSIDAILNGDTARKQNDVIVKSTSGHQLFDIPVRPSLIGADIPSSLLLTSSSTPSSSSAYIQVSPCESTRISISGGPVGVANCSTNKKKRSWSRAVFSNLQRKGLEKRFEIQKYVTKPDRRQLAAMLGLTDAQVKVWFQNRRMKWRHQEEVKRTSSNSDANEIQCSNDRSFLLTPNNRTGSSFNSSDSDADSDDDDDCCHSNHDTGVTSFTEHLQSVVTATTTAARRRQVGSCDPLPRRPLSTEDNVLTPVTVSPSVGSIVGHYLHHHHRIYQHSSS